MTDRPNILHNLDWCWRHPENRAMDWTTVALNEGGQSVLEIVGICAECKQAEAEREPVGVKS